MLLDVLLRQNVHLSWENGRVRCLVYYGLRRSGKYLSSRHVLDLDEGLDPVKAGRPTMALTQDLSVALDLLSLRKGLVRNRECLS